MLNSFPLEHSLNLSSGVISGKTESGRTCSSISFVTSLAMPVQMEYWCMSGENSSLESANQKDFVESVDFGPHQ